MIVPNLLRLARAKMSCSLQCYLIDSGSSLDGSGCCLAMSSTILPAARKSRGVSFVLPSTTWGEFIAAHIAAHLFLVAVIA
mmetsp:Transcript_35434/g.79514  ORF Transcript_35434/g.79514 Transcript_35434/m.79514 type:complete len:81 (+) Transcript_35434:2016-2258(+)